MPDPMRAADDTTARTPSTPAAIRPVAADRSVEHRVDRIIVGVRDRGWVDNLRVVAGLRDYRAATGAPLRSIPVPLYQVWAAQS